MEALKLVAVAVCIILTTSSGIHRESANWRTSDEVRFTEDETVRATANESEAIAVLNSSTELMGEDMKPIMQESHLSIATQNHTSNTKESNPDIAAQNPTDDSMGDICISCDTANVPQEDKVIYNAIVEVQATYPGGEAALLKFVNNNLVYPPTAQEEGLQGTVVLRFRVEKDGSIGKITIKKSLSKECDQAATNVVKKLRRFTPARQKGQPVPVWFTLPIRFSMQESDFPIAVQDYTGDGKGVVVDDLKDTLQTDATNVSQEEEIMDNAIVEVQATYPGGEAALLKFVKTTWYIPQLSKRKDFKEQLSSVSAWRKTDRLARLPSRRALPRNATRPLPTSSRSSAASRPHFSKVRLFPYGSRFLSDLE